MTFQEAINIIDRYDVNFIYGDGEPIPAEQIAEAMAMAVRSLTAWGKVRKEIDECIIDCDLDFGNEMFYNNAILDALKIIDKHLSEVSE